MVSRFNCLDAMQPAKELFFSMQALAQNVSRPLAEARRKDLAWKSTAAESHPGEESTAESSPVANCKLELVPRLGWSLHLCFLLFSRTFQLPLLRWHPRSGSRSGPPPLQHSCDCAGKAGIGRKRRCSLCHRPCRSGQSMRRRFDNRHLHAESRVRVANVVSTSVALAKPLSAAVLWIASRVA